jgi:hypothetical protein
VSCAFVFFIEVDGIVGIELSHKQREVLSSGLKEYMVVVIHQTVVMDIDFVSFARFAEYL